MQALQGGNMEKPVVSESRYVCGGKTSECPADSPNVRVTKYGHHMDAFESPTRQRTRRHAGPPSIEDYLHKNESAVGGFIEFI